MRSRHAVVQYDVVTQPFLLGLGKTIGVDLEGGGELDLVSREISKAFTALLAGQQRVSSNGMETTLSGDLQGSHARALSPRASRLAADLINVHIAKALVIVDVLVAE